MNRMKSDVQFISMRNFVSVNKNILLDYDMRPNATGEWTEVRCDWFDHVKSMQNNYYWNRQFEGSPIVFLYGIVCTFGALANLVVLFAFIRTSNLRNLRNSFIINLACSDLLLCVITAPVTLYSSVNLFWPFGNISCKVVGTVKIFLKYLLRCKRLAATAPIICYCIVWIISVTVALPYSLAVRSQLVDTFEPWNNKYAPSMLNVCNRSYPEICVEIQDTWDRAYISKTSFTLVVLALQVSGSKFSSLFIKSQPFNRAIDQRRRLGNRILLKNVLACLHKSLLLLLVLVLTYATCWAPMNIYNVLNGFDMIEYSQYSLSITYCNA
uniref:G_PROTEIN_RECEP_F1_2 domain-containing protein n=1 Tax=Heterorhabditis bacteriophora TaxID=37862 RepID=A0A1I7W690_HETBA